MVCSIFMLIGLSSCGTKAKREVIRDYPQKALAEALNLNQVQNGKSLHKDLDKSKAYSDVLIAENPKDTLFYQTIELDEYMNDRFKQINLKILYFNDQIPSTDAASFMTEMNHKEYGITEDFIGHTFKSTEGYSETLFGKLSLAYGVKLPKEYSSKEEDKATLVVAYLPTYCIYNDGTQDYTKVFIFVPVYYAFTYESSVKEYTEGIKHQTITLTDKNLLPSEE